ncbi:hypothetical protein FIV00_02895 [Labrenzia sp. THAF82]|uniref:hypothetical protein n=1 Tax=Labrenzia sp. THAF82 TaxID=2587861 RepID=UPI00126822E7|nr:hypothetical protein [Labrenzia sp. THAF82]QFT29422.1 hypothetical protein FIV00_02895 [Labrenzia sp. THAF82]
MTRKEAYGLDFTPACFNLEDFEKLAEQAQAGRKPSRDRLGKITKRGQAENNPAV